MAKPPMLAVPPASPDSRFRGQIEAAVAGGIAPAEMILRLTLRDANLLTRDRTIAVSDISFSEGVMRFLGVRVQSGGVPASVLDKSPEPEPEEAVSPAPKPARAPRARKKPLAVRDASS